MNTLCLAYQDGCPKRDACRAVGYCIDYTVVEDPPPRRSIIALCGPKGSGKSTLAKLLHKHGYVSVNFADPLKAMLRVLLEKGGLDSKVTDRILFGDLKEFPLECLCGSTARYAMQTLGSEWRDMIDKKLWSRIWERYIDNHPEATKIVVEDMRFLHEYRAIRRQDADSLSVRIDRDGFTTSQHLSEREFLLIPVDLTITNDSAPENMLRQLNLGER